MNSSVYYALREYFVFETVLGKFCDKKKIFPLLEKIFFLSEEESATCERLLNLEILSQIRTINDYYRCKQVAKYVELNGEDPLFRNEEEEVVSLKGKVIERVLQARLFATEDAAEMTIYDNLLTQAEGLQVLALRIRGILGCAGIGLPSDPVVSLRSLHRAARWGDTASALALLFFGNGPREKYLAIFLACIKGTLNEDLRARVVPAIDPAAKLDNCVRMLIKGQAAGRANENVIDPALERVMFSEVIDEEAKEALLFSVNKQLVSDACELPLSLSYSHPFPVEEAALRKWTFGRDKEIEAIVKNLRSADIRTTEAYSPLCLCSDSRVTRSIYYNALKEAMPQVNVVKVRPPLLSSELERSNNHLFLTALNEKKANALVLFFEERLDGSVVELFRRFLEGDNRQRFRLQHPAMTLDLGSVLPICISDKDYMRPLEPYADVIRIDPPDGEEKKKIAQMLAERYCGAYGLTVVKVEEKLAEEFAAMKVDDVDAVLKKVFLFGRDKIASEGITLAMAEPFLKGKGNKGFAFGFGGN